MNPKTKMVIEIEEALELPRTNTLYNMRSDELKLLRDAVCHYSNSNKGDDKHE